LLLADQVRAGATVGDKHYGNLADVFKHLALGELLAMLRPAEYWESHAGAASYAESDPPAEERVHGIHYALSRQSQSHLLTHTTYFRMLNGMIEKMKLRTVPGSPKLAHYVMPQLPKVRRFLFCEQDAESLVSIQKLFGTTPLVECICDDGTMILRGAALMLSAEWSKSTLAFLDPNELDGATDAGITPLELACELGNREIPTMLWYGFKDDAQRRERVAKIEAAMGKALLTKRGARRFEGKLVAPPDAALTQWGFGLLVQNCPEVVMERVDSVLHALAGVYKEAPLGASSGAWEYSRAVV
jgi:23S rRNA A2030 N6-methylase RlmJ